MEKEKTLKEPPLLNPVSQGEDSQWIEITPEQIKGLRDLLVGFRESDQWASYAEHAVRMRRMRLELREDPKRYETQIKGAMDKYAREHPLFPTQHVQMLANMKILGLDISQYKEDERASYSAEWLKNQRADEVFIELAANLKVLGEDVDAFVRRREGKLKRLIEEKYIAGNHWFGYTVFSAKLKAIGIGIPGVHAHKRDAETVLGLKAGDKDWGRLAQQASAMADLGLLTPNTDAKEAHLHSIPPLRKFGGGR